MTHGRTRRNPNGKSPGLSAQHPPPSWMLTQSRPTPKGPSSAVSPGKYRPQRTAVGAEGGVPPWKLTLSYFRVTPTPLLAFIPPASLAHSYPHTHLDTHSWPRRHIHRKGTLSHVCFNLHFLRLTHTDPHRHSEARTSHSDTHYPGAVQSVFHAFFF